MSKPTMKFKKHKWLPQLGKPDVFRCMHCYLFKKLYGKQESYSKDGTIYQVVGNSAPMPQCLPVQNPKPITV